MLKSLPFTEVHKEGSTYERTFSSDLSPEDLKWHWDEEDRIVYPLEENDWSFQYDNMLPEKISVGNSIKIPKGVWHRVIKGSGDLKIIVIKN